VEIKATATSIIAVVEIRFIIFFVLVYKMEPKATYLFSNMI